MSKKMYFNTGVRPENRLDIKGNVVMMEHQTIKGGVLQIEYWLEREPESDLHPKFLASESYLTHLTDNEVAIKIVGGGMLSEYGNL